MARFEIHQDTQHDGCYEWWLMTDSDEKVAVSQSYFTKRHAIDAAKTVIQLAPSAQVYDMTM
jgi:uncharacterized protein YegP (UPF0339 family)